jgi:hypothetical protein
MALGLASCPAELVKIEAQWAAFVDQVNAILATGCSTVLPAFTVTATTIELVVNALYPGVGAAVGGIVGAVQAVANAICNVKPGKLGAAPSSASLPSTEKRFRFRSTASPADRRANCRLIRGGISG